MTSAVNTVFMVDDDDAVRDALTLMLRQSGMAVEAFASAEAFLAFCQPEHRGCAVVDMRMPGMDGMQLQQALSGRGILLPIIFLTGHGDIPLSVRAIKAGAVDFLTKPVSRKQLLASVQSAMQAGEAMRSRHQHQQQAAVRLQTLTEREREVMLMAVAGHPNKEIARSLGISHRTVEIHKAHIMHKTGVSNLLDLARLAQEAE
jgi:FixJ family two-component response regulator